ncbi:hypothetical protein TDB9533_04363 [Thalassocella blandensis]|nr:hypothetical protein TDB9533_04363 [Thalassocella blandensis]
MVEFMGFVFSTQEVLDSLSKNTVFALVVARVKRVLLRAMNS